jgi:hypothetical protein
MLANALGYVVPREDPSKFKDVLNATFVDDNAPREAADRTIGSRYQPSRPGDHVQCVMPRRALGPIDEPLRSKMRAIIEALQAKVDEVAFMPVDASAPIDLSTIIANLDTYISVHDFAADVRRVLDGGCTEAQKLTICGTSRLFSHFFEMKLACALEQVRARACIGRPQNDTKRPKWNSHEETDRNSSNTAAPTYAPDYPSSFSAVSRTPMPFANCNFPPLHLSGCLEYDVGDDTKIAASLWHNATTKLVVPSATVVDGGVLEALWLAARNESLSRQEYAARKNEDRERRILEACINEAKRREECLAELERSREAEAARDRQKREDEMKNKRKKDEQRKRDREAARRNRDKLEQTVDLDMQRFAVSSFLEAAGSSFPESSRRAE